MRKIFITLAIVVVFTMLAGSIVGQRIEISRLQGRADLAEAKSQAIQIELDKARAENASLKDELRRAESRVQVMSMVASWYGQEFHGKPTASGEQFNASAFTCAHRDLPFGTVIVVEANGHRVVCVVNDRGPFIKGRDVDLSYATANALGMVRKGVDRVKVYQVRI